MKSSSRFVALSFAIVSITLAQEKYSDEIKPYVNFLQSQHVSVKDYIISLFNKHDIVILCERTHTEFTQYELIASIVEDKRFIDSVANIFTEIGSVSQTSDVDRLLHTDNMSSDSLEAAILRFQRNCSFWPLWPNKNLSFFIRRLYDLNQKLPTNKKVNLYPSDLPFDWSIMDTSRLKALWGTAGLRDSVIASHIIDRFDKIRLTPAMRRKALVIMNYRHAFGHRWQYPVGSKPANVGRFLFDRYGKRVANVYLNGLALADKGASVLIQQGKWDASFKAAGFEDLGFDFLNSPYGQDQFDIWPYKDHGFKYQDVFTGFAFYLPLDKQKIAWGIPGLIDSSFAQEVIRRFKMYDAVPNLQQNVPTDWHTLQKEFTVTHEFKIPGLDSLSIQTLKWLH